MRGIGYFVLTVGAFVVLVILYNIVNPLYVMPARAPVLILETRKIYLGMPCWRMLPKELHNLYKVTTAGHARKVLKYKPLQQCVEAGYHVFEPAKHWYLKNAWWEDERYQAVFSGGKGPIWEQRRQ